MTHVFLGWFMVIFFLSWRLGWNRAVERGEKSWLSMGMIPKYHRPLKVQIYLVSDVGGALTQSWTFSLDEPSKENLGCVASVQLKSLRCQGLWIVLENARESNSDKKSLHWPLSLAQNKDYTDDKGNKPRGCKKKNSSWSLNRKSWV